MTLVYWAAGLILAYFSIVWIALRFIVPSLGWKKSPLPVTLPTLWQEAIDRLNKEATDDFDFLQRAYSFVTSRYVGNRLKTVLHFWVAFQDPLLRPPGFLPCNSQNYVLRVMLVKSGRFKDSDIVLKIMPVNTFIHQYLRVRVGERYIDVDPWSSFLGIPLGKKSPFFH